MKTARKLTALLLSFLLVLSVIPSSVLADAADEAAAYRTEVFQRYDAYLADTGSNYTGLAFPNDYTHCAWAQEIESYGAARKSILWATHKLTGKELDADAYADYLMKIMTMQEKGMLDTLAAQAAYTAKAGALDNALNIGGAVLSAVLDADAIKEIANGLKAAKSTVNFFDVVEENVMDTQKAVLLTYYSKSYEQKLAFLTAIRDNTDDKALKEAASDLIHAASLEFAYLFMNDDMELSAMLGGIALQMGGFDDFNDAVSGLVEKGGRYLADRFDPKSKNFQATLGKLSIPAGSLSQKTLRIFGLGASYFSAITAGFAIGGAIGAAFWGDDIEQFREMKAMAVIGEALGAGVNDYVTKANAGYDEEAYENVRNMVAAGQALAYVRLRGEYCAVESIRGKDTAPPNLDEIYNNTADRLVVLHNALATIFPPQGMQVIVNADIETFNGETLEYYLTHPVVYLPGNKEVEDKINHHPVMQALNNNTASALAENQSLADEYAHIHGYPYTYNLYLDTVYSTNGALSMMFSEIVFLGGAHPMHGYFGFSFDLKTGEALTLKDLLNPENPNAENQLFQLFAADLSAQISDDWAFQNSQDAIRDVFTGAYRSKDGFDIWGFTRDGLTITFAPYAIGPYAAGYFTVTVPYRDLEGIIHPDYLLEDRTGALTDGYPYLHTAEVDTNAYSAVYGDPDAYAFAGEGALYDVWVGKDNGSRQSPGMQGILLYANHVKPTDLFWLSENKSDSVIVDFRTYSRSDPKGMRSTIRLYSDGYQDDIHLES